MPEYVRVKDKDTGHKLSVPASEVENNPDAYQVLKQDAVDTSGLPLPPEHATTSGSSSAGKSAQPDSKES